MPVADDAVSRLLANQESIIRLVALVDDVLVGIGALMPNSCEFSACYVAPDMARKGVGTALALEIERIAQECGLAMLYVQSSVTAEPFYQSLGYKAVGRDEHILKSGRSMACLHMQKELRKRS